MLSDVRSGILAMLRRISSVTGPLRAVIAPTEALACRGIALRPCGIAYIRTRGGRLANTGVFAHMMSGALVTLLAPLQPISRMRDRWPALHRAIGYLLFVTAILTTGGGLACIAVRGTIGRWLMDIGFSLRGACPVVTAVVTVRHARRRDRERYRRWALRFFVLAIASWLYRVHHGVWHADGRVVIGEGLFRSFRSDPEFRFLRSLPDRSRDPFRFPTASR
jgi:hypothetical protein